ncbi:uncharacterized protein LOC141619002 [Silene latifolia]|uniref:uncharacterized protein LOC141619002 n=1 Tax=Silene latifolia TaxID=37657 RepID=UPI003D770609
MKEKVKGPWVVMGDFNNVLAKCERIGSEVTNAEMKDFEECVDNCGLVDLSAPSAFFTWNNKHKPRAMVFSRLDKTMVNDDRLVQFPDTSTMFHLESLFDHCPCTLQENTKKGMDIRYFNMWGTDPGFKDIVKDVWNGQIPGYKMFRVVKKLNLLKQPLKNLNGTGFDNIETADNVARLYLHHTQMKLQADPTNVSLQ